MDWEIKYLGSNPRYAPIIAWNSDYNLGFLTTSSVYFLLKYKIAWKVLRGRDHTSILTFLEEEAKGQIIKDHYVMSFVRKHRES